MLNFISAPPSSVPSSPFPTLSILITLSLLSLSLSPSTIPSRYSSPISSPSLLNPFHRLSSSFPPTLSFLSLYLLCRHSASSSFSPSYPPRLSISGVNYIEIRRYTKNISTYKKNYQKL